jgi:hypothetical protein
MTTRIMTIGPGRIFEAICVLQFDHNLHPLLDKTLIASPYNKAYLTDIFEQYKINYSNFEFLSDSDLIEKYELEEWAKNHWYLQQGIKLSLLDDIESDYFLIHDCDVFATRRYDYIQDNKLNFRVEDLWNPYQTVYADKVEKLIDYKRVVNFSFVTEIFPYKKIDWDSCKNRIENLSQCNWKQAIRNIGPFDSSKWLSEYELLGIFKTNTNNEYYLNWDPHPIVNNWDDFETADWSDAPLVKFRTRPLKFLAQDKIDLVVNKFKIKKEL